MKKKNLRLEGQSRFSIADLKEAKLQRICSFSCSSKRRIIAFRSNKVIERGKYTCGATGFSFEEKKI